MTLGDSEGDGSTLSLGDGAGDSEGLSEGDGSILSLGDGVGDGLSERDGEGDAVAAGDGVGEGLGLGLTSILGLTEGVGSMLGLIEGDFSGRFVIVLRSGSKFTSNFAGGAFVFSR